ncbi:MAG: ribonuclease HII [Fusobacteriaceae bacterium]|nr:ribonuclease HII [Fusobacteriaceae bacterium]
MESKRPVENLAFADSPLGPVIGPMVMCGVVIEEKDTDKLLEIGVKDSKLLTPKQRENLFEKIKKIAKSYEIIIISPEEIDKTLESEDLNLNWLEALTSAKILNKLRPDKAILDCPSNNIKAYSNYVKKNLNKEIELIAEHKADLNYPVVGAASILAKVTRDREIEKIKKKIKINFGSGYPSDPITVEFLKKYWNKHPEIFRKTWASYRKIAEAKGQKSLGDF